MKTKTQNAQLRLWDKKGRRTKESFIFPSLTENATPGDVVHVGLRYYDTLEGPSGARIYKTVGILFHKYATQLGRCDQSHKTIAMLLKEHLKRRKK